MAKGLRVVLLVAVSLGTIAAGRAQADEKDEPYAAGRRAYDLRDFDRAIREWKRGFEKTGDPAYLYNIGSAYREQHDYERATFYYQRFLHEAPTSPKRDAIQKRIEEMKGAMTAPPRDPQAPGEKEKAEPAPPPPPPAASPPPVAPPPAEAARAAEPPSRATPPPPDPHPGRGLRIAGITTAGAGAALLVVGTLFVLAAGSAHDQLDAAEAQHAPWTAALADAQASGRRDQLIAVVALGTGATALAAGAVLTYLGIKQGRVAVEPQVLGLALKVRF